MAKNRKPKGADQNVQLRINNVRLSFPNMLVREVYNGVVGKYSAVAIIEKDSWGHGPKGKKIKIGKFMAKAILEACEKTWPGKGEEMFTRLKKHKDEHALLRDGNGKTVQSTGEIYDGYKGKVYFKASCNKPANVIDSEGNIVTEDNKSGVSGTVPYSGCRVDVIFEVWAQKTHGKQCVNAKLQVVRFREDDEALGNGGQMMSADAAQDAFADEIDESEGKAPKNDSFNEEKLMGKGKKDKKNKKNKKDKKVKKNRKDKKGKGRDLGFDDDVPF